MLLVNNLSEKILTPIELLKLSIMSLRFVVPGFLLLFFTRLIVSPTIVSSTPKIVQVLLNISLGLLIIVPLAIGWINELESYQKAKANNLPIHSFSQWSFDFIIDVVRVFALLETFGIFVFATFGYLFIIPLTSGGPIFLSNTNLVRLQTAIAPYSFAISNLSNLILQFSVPYIILVVFTFILWHGRDLPQINNWNDLYLLSVKYYHDFFTKRKVKVY